MKNLIKILSQDLNVFSKYLNLQELDACNIISNRMISNSILIDSKEYNLIGCCLKNHIIKLKRIITFEEREKSILDFQKYVEKIKKNPDLNYILINYYNLFKEILRKLIPNEEKEIYTENLEFSKKSHKILIEFLIKELNNDSNYHSLNLVHNGILNELNRINRSHGLEMEELILQFVISYSGRLYQYFRILILNSNKIEYWSTKWEEFKVLITNSLREYLNDDENYIPNSISLLYILSKEWRLMFIRILEPASSSISSKIPIDLPLSIKNKISDLISKGINIDFDKKKSEE